MVLLSTYIFKIWNLIAHVTFDCIEKANIKFTFHKSLNVTKLHNYYVLIEVINQPKDHLEHLA